MAGTAAAQTPVLIALGPGIFKMGSNAGEQDEKPEREIAVAAFRLATYQVTVAEFRRFVDAAGYAPPAGCNRYTLGKLTADPDLSWRNPGYPQTDNHPISCIGWNDAQAYIAWLNGSAGGPYRLPTEAEGIRGEGRARRREFLGRPGGRLRVRQCLGPDRRRERSAHDP